VTETSLEKKRPGTLKEKGQYAVAFGVIGTMLFFAGFPVFLLLFVGVLTFFIWKVFTAEGRNETRRIFEFYLSANEILRDDERRWYGFEIQETIARGENIVRSMGAAPPLVYFSLGALYQKLDDHSSAVKNLAQVVDENAQNETAIVYPAKELREYVRMLRKIERAPAEAPLTSAAVRSLERARKNRGNKLLEHSRLQLTKQVVPLPQAEQKLESIVDAHDTAEPNAANGDATHYQNIPESIRPMPASFTSSVTRKTPARAETETSPVDRKTISEVLHDIYDKNVQ
jgi:hypothetical protein